MNNLVFKSFLTFCLLLTSTLLNAQVCVQIDEGNNKVLAGTDHIIRIKVNNVPKTGVVKIKANGSDIKSDNGEASLLFNSPDEGLHAVNIIITVSVNKKQVFKESRYLEYVTFLPAIVMEKGGSDYLYKGIESDLYLGVPGIPISDLIISPYAGLFLRKKGNIYTASLSGNATEVSIGIAAKMDDGSIKSMGLKTFRVLDLPPPVCHLNKNLADVKATDTVLNLITDIPPDLENKVTPVIFSFECEVWKDLTSTTYNYFYGTNPDKTSGEISGELLDAIKTMHAGDMLFFKNITVKWINKDGSPVVNTSFAVSKS